MLLNDRQGVDPLSGHSGIFFKLLVFPDIRLHLSDIDVVLDIADGFRDELLNVCDRRERDRLPEQIQVLSLDLSEGSEQVFLEPDIGVVELDRILGLVQFADRMTQSVIVPRDLLLIAEIPFRNAVFSHQKPVVLPGLIPEAVGDVSCRHGLPAHVVVKLEDDVGRKAAGADIVETGLAVVADLTEQVSLEGPCGALICRLVEECSALVAEHDHLNGIDDRRFPAAGVSRQEVDFLKRDLLPVIGVPVEKQQLF